ncbi:MAG: sulfatase-like hydrolase/transferase [Prolixibacteraceae bacterium]
MPVTTSGRAARNNPPNIIVIFCDDLGYADLSCYDSVWNQTPEINQMATEGVRFTLGQFTEKEEEVRQTILVENPKPILKK